MYEFILFCDNNLKQERSLPTALSIQAHNHIEYRSKIPLIMQPMIEKMTKEFMSKPGSYKSEVKAEPFTKYKGISDISKTIPSKISAIKLHSSHVSKSPGLIHVFYPSNLISRFIMISEPNTKNNIETCGILCGVKRDSYFVTNIFVPDQQGTSDMCVTCNYEEIEQYVNNNNLLVLGWIHTHPGYDCFLSSIDLHTQYSYQKLLPESIAIVYSGLSLPANERLKAFRVRDKYMDELEKCTLKMFHKHSVPDTQLFEECSHIEEYDPSANGVNVSIDGYI